jgi:hypothetical protein
MWPSVSYRHWAMRPKLWSVLSRSIGNHILSYPWSRTIGRLALRTKRAQPVPLCKKWKSVSSWNTCRTPWMKGGCRGLLRERNTVVNTVFRLHFSAAEQINGQKWRLIYHGGRPCRARAHTHTLCKPNSNNFLLWTFSIGLLKVTTIMAQPVAHLCASCTHFNFYTGEQAARVL